MNNLHPIFQQALAPFAPPPEIDIKKRVRDAIARGLSPVIEHNGDTWRVIGISKDRNGAHYCHLASTTRFQRTPFDDCPTQILEWISDDVLAEALAHGVQ